MSARLSPLQTTHLVERIRELGQQRGLTRDSELTAACGLPGTSIRDMARGVQGPTLGTLLAICHGLKLYSIDQLLGFSATSFFASTDRVETALGTLAPALYSNVLEPLLQDP